MSQDEPEESADADRNADRSEHGRDASEETVEDVDHEHPTTGETFDRTGVHGRGKEHPKETGDEEQAADAESEGVGDEVDTESEGVGDEEDTESEGVGDEEATESEGVGGESATEREAVGEDDALVEDSGENEDA